MPTVHVAPYRSIASMVAERLLAGRGADPLAPWSLDVVVPSRGMAEAIAAEVLAREPRGVAGLRIRFLAELAQAIVNDAGQWPRVANDTERRLAMRIAVRTVSHPMMEGRGIAAMLERSYRDLRDSGLRIAQITPRRLRNPERTQAIARVFTEYERLVTATGAIDAADLFELAERSLGTVRPQLIAGFYDMTGAQSRFLEALLPLVPDVFVPTDLPFARSFLSLVEFTNWGLTPGCQPKEGGAGYSTRDEELRGVCVRIGKLLESGETSIGITARSLDPHDVHRIHRYASEHGFQVSLGEETPLTAHRIGRGAVTLLRLRERGFPRGEVLELIRDGLRTATRIHADSADSETRRARIAGGTSEVLTPLRGRSRVIDDYIALVTELEAITADLEFERIASLFRLETDSDILAAETLDELAAVFKRMRSTDVGSFIDAIENESIPCAQAADAEHPVVWLGDVMRFRGRSFRHLFVVRMQDDLFPQRRTEDPLFPDSDRRLLGIREIGDGRDEEELLLQLIRDSAENVYFSFAASDGFGRVLRPSRYLRGLPLEQPGDDPPIARQEPAPRQLQLLAKSGTQSVFDGYIPNVTVSLPALSPTQLEDFGECPQKFLLKHLLRVEDIEHPEQELQINHRDKGTLDHRILERFYRSMTPAEILHAAATLPRLDEEVITRLERIVDEEFDEHERLVPPFSRTIRAIERRATRRILREFVAGDLADLAANDLLPAHFEYRFGAKHRVPADHPEPFVVRAGGAEVRVEGTIDRIDTGPARLRIVDYKSGKALRHTDLPAKIDRGVRLQLALYAMAAAEFFSVDAANVSGTIKPLVTGDKQKFAFELAEKREGILQTLEIFVRAIANGVFPAFPEDDDFNSCKYCPVNHSCRTRHDPEERYAMQQERDARTLLGGGRE